MKPLNPTKCWHGQTTPNQLLHGLQRVLDTHPDTPENADVRGVAYALAARIWPEWNTEQNRKKE